MINFRIRRTWLKACLALTLAGGLTAGCTENINQDNFAIATDQTVTDYLSAQPELSAIKSLMDRVRLGRTEGASSLSSVMSARGNYTVFAPTNEAVSAYLQEIGVASVDELTYDQAELVAKSCVIDNGSSDAYESADFPTPGSFGESNLNDRTLTSTQDDAGNYYINGEALVVQPDIDLSNGRIHVVDKVIAPSSDFLPDRIAAADNLLIFSHLLTATTWADSLRQYRDEDYESMNYSEETDYRIGSSSSIPMKVSMHRYIGYTALVETDDVYARDWGITLDKDAEGNVTNWDEVMATVRAKCAEIYPEASGDDLASPENAVNRFVAYHVLQGSMAYDRFNRHCNEYNYTYGSDILNPQTLQMPTNVWDYYTTVGKYRGLVKITQVGDAGFEADLDHHIYANRISIYDNGRTGDYHETGVTKAGARLSHDNGENDNNALNGFYFPVSEILAYDDATRRLLGGERMRIDVTTMMPEIASNNLRAKNYYLFPLGFFDNIMNESSDTKICYLTDMYGGGWNDYQGDEWLFCGIFDFTLRLPPVPTDGTYEIRMGIGMNSARGMGQIYFGDDPWRLAPTGLPVDMRQTASNNPNMPWHKDTGDADTDAEYDKHMRNQGFMKAPNYFYYTGNTSETVRNREGWTCIRYIITRNQMEADKTYYLRFKTALKKRDAEFFLDYLEIVPTQIYNSPTPEDIW